MNHWKNIFRVTVVGVAAWTILAYSYIPEPWSWVSQVFLGYSAGVVSWILWDLSETWKQARILARELNEEQRIRVWNNPDSKIILVKDWKEES